MSKTKFTKWLETADRGDEYIYHRGDLGVDRYVTDSPDYADINRTANAAFEAQQEGFVQLFQQRANPGSSARLYIARRTPTYIGTIAPTDARANGYGRRQGGYGGPNRKPRGE